MQTTLKKPLSEGALAEVIEAMRLLSAAYRRIDAMEGRLAQLHIPVDPAVFRVIKSRLDDAHIAIQYIPLASAEAAARGGK